MLRLEIDARMLGAGGIGRYISEIVGPWLCADDVRSARLYGRVGDLEEWLNRINASGDIEIVAWNDPVYSLSAQANWIRLTHERRSWTPDVSFFPHFDAPLFAHPRPSVVVVHDLIHLKMAAAFPWWKSRLAAGMIRRVASKTARIISVSETSRRDIVAFLGQRAPPVEVIRNGVSEFFKPGEEGPADAPYMLVVAPHKHHKNLSHAAEVVLQLPRHEGWRLVIVGPNSSDLRDLVRKAGDPELEEIIDIPGSVSDAVLRRFYRRARVVLVPSLLEGFALPALEARACGTRVLVPDLPWARELAPIGVELVAGWDARVWARAVQRMPTSVSGLSGPPSGNFTWSDASAETLALISRVAGLGSRQRRF